MVYLSKIYTKTGDDGTTALGDGTRVEKTHPRIGAYGSADELGAVIGVAASVTTEGDLRECLQRIQNDLFDLGADLCVPGETSDQALRIVAGQTERLENEIDEVNETLEPLNSFVLSGGSPTAAHLHHARCVARRCEREVLALARSEPINLECVRYLNRLSDLLFCLARAANAGGDEVLWKPGAERDPKSDPPDTGSSE